MTNLVTLGLGPGSSPSLVLLQGFVPAEAAPVIFKGCQFSIDDNRGDLGANALGAIQANKVSAIEVDLCQ